MTVDLEDLNCFVFLVLNVPKSTYRFKFLITDNCGSVIFFISKTVLIQISSCPFKKAVIVSFLQPTSLMYSNKSFIFF